MTAVDDRALLIKDYVMDRFRRGLPGVKMNVLCADLNLIPSSRTRTAINRAREWLKAEGFLMPAASPNAGQVYAVTLAGSDVVDPALWLDSITEGVERRSAEHWEFAQGHPEGLSELEQVLVDMRVGQLSRHREEAEEFRRVLTVIRSA